MFNTNVWGSVSSHTVYSTKLNIIYGLKMSKTADLDTISNQICYKIYIIILFVWLVATLLFIEYTAWHRAAIQIMYDNFMTIISDTHFSYNVVDYDHTNSGSTPKNHHSGGSVSCHSCKVEIIYSTFEDNKGVALLGTLAKLVRIESCQFLHNSAAELGGAIYATLQSSVETSGTISFESNVAKDGAAFHTFLSTIFKHCWHNQYSKQHCQSRRHWHCSQYCTNKGKHYLQWEH